jgi:TatA/E family protein of Tat protein translocase
MFDLGIQELIVIFIVALLVFGPKKLPELGRTLGKGIAELKRAMQGVKEQMDAELHDIKQPVSLEADVYKSEQKTEDKIADSPDKEKNTKNG